MEAWKRIRSIYRGCSARESEHFLLIGVQGISLLSFITRGKSAVGLSGDPRAVFLPLKVQSCLGRGKRQELLSVTSRSTQGFKAKFGAR